MLSSELGNRYAATRVYQAVSGNRGGLAACGARSGRRETATSDCSILIDINAIQ